MTVCHTPHGIVKTIWRAFTPSIPCQQKESSDDQKC